MQKKAIALALGAALAAPIVNADVELAGKEVVLYGKLHVSVDQYDLGTQVDPTVSPTGTEITSNSSRIGFKGEKALDSGVSAVWKFESEIDVSGEYGNLKERNRYLGLKGGFGSLVFGVADTPFKNLGSDYTLFGDTVGDRRGILGQTSAGKNLFNVRAKSMALYEAEAGGLKASLMYSSDFEGKTNPDNAYDNSLVSAGLNYQAGGFSVGAAWEQQKGIGATTTAPVVTAAGLNASGLRVGAKYKAGDFQVGAIYEQLTDDGYGAAVERNAYGVNASYALGNTTLAAQYLKADESNVGNDGASQYSIGAYYKLAKNAQVYGMYGNLANDTGASYVMPASGHGEKLAPTQAGETVSAVSLGMIYDF